MQRTGQRGASLAERHAGVLALAALVMLAPYGVPEWLPQVLDRLASFANQPQPIKAAVTKSFADFRRTHQDNWAQHKQRFTEEQQDVLSDMVVAPSFYA
jgi:proteasome activator subunit 4